jgi:hypothetical protein
LSPLPLILMQPYHPNKEGNGWKKVAYKYKLRALLLFYIPT